MRTKLTLLLTCLLTLCSGGAWAQVTSIENGGTYLIRFNKNSNFVSPSMKTTKVDAGRFRFDKVGTEGSYDVYTIYSLNGNGYLNRTTTPSNAGTTTITADKEDTDNFKWTLATTVNTGNTDPSIWTISPKGYATASTNFVLTGWTDTFNETNVLKFYSGTSHDLAQLKLAKFADGLNDLSSTTCYNITNPRGWWDVANGATVVNSTVETNLAFSYADTKQQFAFIEKDGKYYLYSVSEKKFAYVDGSKLSLTEFFTEDVASSNVTFVTSTNTKASQYPVVVTLGDKNFGISTGYSPDVFQYTSTDDEGNSSLIVEAGSFDPAEAQAQIANTVQVAYKVVVDGSVVAGPVTTHAFSNAAPVLPSSLQNGYCICTYYSDEACTSEITEVGSNTIIYAKATYTESLPIHFASATDASDAQWYTVKLRDSYIYNNSDAFAISSSEVVTEDGQWVFTGNVYAAQVYNKGARKYLVWNGSAVSFSETAATSWIVKPHSKGDGFMLYEPGNNNFPFIGSSGSVSYSSSGNGNFSEGNNNSADFVVAEIAEDFKESVIANVQPYFTSAVGDFFGLKQQVYDSYNSRVTAAANTSCNATEYNALLEVVNNASNFVFPESGYYRMKNVYTGTYFGKTDADGVVAGLTGTEAASVLKLTRSGEEGNYTYTIQVQGTTFTEQSGNFTFCVAATLPGKFNVNSRTSNVLFGYMYASESSINYNSIASVGNAAQWTIEPATSFTGTLTNAKDNTSKAHSYASLCVPFEITDISGANASTLALNGNHLNLSAGSTTVAAGTPVMLVGEENAGTYTATIGSAYAAAPVASSAGNALSGTFTSTSLDCTKATGTTYVLGFDADNDNRIGFYHVNNTAFPLSANRAYFVREQGESSGVKGFAINFDDDATAISEVSNVQTGNAEVFNISGQRISKPSHGLYIVNGKKVIIK